MKFAMVSLALAGTLVAWSASSMAAEAATGAQATSPLGVWATEEAKSTVKIVDCGGKLCGTIVSLKEPLDDKGKEKVDEHNPDKGLQTRKILGLPLLSGFVKAKDETNVWEDGRIYNPEDGETYKCTLTLKDAGTLRVRGYIGIPMLGKTQIWTRVE
jgi:uncharacterized protein (DUF2147 family)